MSGLCAALFSTIREVRAPRVSRGAFAPTSVFRVESHIFEPVEISRGGGLPSVAGGVQAEEDARETHAPGSCALRYGDAVGLPSGASPQGVQRVPQSKWMHPLMAC